MFWRLITIGLWAAITVAVVVRLWKTWKAIKESDGSVFQAVLFGKPFWMLLFWAFTTAGFMMFIVEETMQIRGFGRYGLQQAKLWREAAEAVNDSVDALQRDRGILRFMSILNPPAGYVFGRYADAEAKKLEWEMTRIEAELANINSRVTIIEDKLKIKPIETGPDPPHSPSRPRQMADVTIQGVGKLSFPKQIDYQTHAERIEESKAMVFVTQFGRKYHRSSCRSIKGRQGVRRITETEAMTEDKTPCLRCKP